METNNLNINFGSELKVSFMKINITIALILLTFSVNAQKIRFINHGNQWTTSGQQGVMPDCPFKHTITYGPDTLLSGNIYQVVSNYTYVDTITPGCSTIFHFDSLYYVREDTMAGMVYFRSPSIDTLEHILYNYNLIPGETINYNYIGYTGITDSLAKIDSVLINSRYYKLYYFIPKYPNPPDVRSYIVLEGIGCLVDPFFPVQGGCFEYMEGLNCFSQNGYYPPMPALLDSLETNYYPTSFPCSYYGHKFTNSCALSTQKLVIINENTLFPNPANDLITIEMKETFSYYTQIVVYDYIGNCVYKTYGSIGQKQLNINTSYWKDGLYFVNINDETSPNLDNHSTWKKIIILH